MSDLTDVHFFWVAVLQRDARTESDVAAVEHAVPAPPRPPDQTVGFTRRMQTYEATMHRVDAELTAGLPLEPVTPDVAAGAVDHAVDVMWGWPSDGAGYEPPAVVEFIATDAESGGWSRSAS